MTRYAWAAIAAAVAVAIGVWCYANFEWVSERRYVGYRGEAARNPLLALQRLAERMGAGVTVVRRAADLDDVSAGGTLVLTRSRHGMSAARVQRLVDWVNGGGHLIVEAERPDERDALLDALRVGRSVATAPPKSAGVRLPGADRVYAVELGGMLLTDFERRGAPAQPPGAALHFNHGAGVVTVLPSLWFVTNDAIGRNDHADFAWTLLELGPDARPAPVTRVLIAPRFESPSLVEWLLERGSPALATGLVLLVLWLWRASRLFGPVLPKQRPERRRLLDHLRASGRYQWAAGAGPRLLAGAREAALTRISRMRPGLADLPPAERVARFAELTGLARSEIDLALNGEAHSPRAFTAAVQTLQTMEEKLARRASA